MSTYSDYEQRLLDQQSGAELDRLAERRAAKLIDHVIDVMHKPPMPQGAAETQCPVCLGTYGTHADGCTYE